MMLPRNHFGRIQQIASPQRVLLHLQKFQLIKTWIRSLTRRFNRAARSKKVVWGSKSFRNKGSKIMWRIRTYTSGSKRNVSHPKTVPWSDRSWKSLTCIYIYTYHIHITFLWIDSCCTLLLYMELRNGEINLLSTRHWPHFCTFQRSELANFFGERLVVSLWRLDAPLWWINVRSFNFLVEQNFL